MIAIIAALIILHDAIAATRRLTVGAVVFGDIVAIITALAGTNKAIAAACVLAGVQAPVGVIEVAVITFFARIDLTVTAWVCLTMMTAVVGVIIGIIATFSGTHDAVAAASDRAIGTTAIGIDRVPIITGFKA